MNFRQIVSGLDVAPLLTRLTDTPSVAEEDEGFPYPTDEVRWRRRTEWTHKKNPELCKIYDTYNIVLRYVTLGYEDQRLYLYEKERGRDEWTRHFGDTLIEAWSIVHDLARAIMAEHVGHVIITRLPPGGDIDEHVDRFPPVPGLPYWQRYQVPLQADEGVTFTCGGEDLYMAPGNAYWFDNQKPHSVRNRSGRDRISMIVELRPMFR